MEKEKEVYEKIDAHLAKMEKGREWYLSHRDEVSVDADGFYHLVGGSVPPEAIYFFECHNKWHKEGLEKSRLHEAMFGKGQVSTDNNPNDYIIDEEI